MMRMSAMIAILPFIALSACVAPMAGAERPPAGILNPVMPTEFPAAEETRMMPRSPGDDPQIMPPQLVTPEMSDQLAFDQAVAAGTSAALIMFLARNPAAPKAPEIRRLLDLRRTPDSPAVTAAAAGADSGVVMDFDTARLVGTVAAWDAFLSRHGGHPLAQQVPFF